MDYFLKRRSRALFHTVAFAKVTRLSAENKNHAIAIYVVVLFGCWDLYTTRFGKQDLIRDAVKTRTNERMVY